MLHSSTVVCCVIRFTRYLTVVTLPTATLFSFPLRFALRLFPTLHPHLSIYRSCNVALLLPIQYVLTRVPVLFLVCFTFLFGALRAARLTTHSDFIAVSIALFLLYSLRCYRSSSLSPAIILMFCCCFVVGSLFLLFCCCGVCDVAFTFLKGVTVFPSKTPDGGAVVVRVG